MPKLPKHPSVRQRRNVGSSASVLRVLKPEEIQIPELPKRYDKEGAEIPWELRTQEWWEAIWSSPMAPEFHESDIEGLYDLAVLKQQFWKYGDPRIHGEIRLYEQQFGLNPMARRKLEWQIEDTEQKQDEGEKRRGSQPPASKRPKTDDGGEIDPYAALA